MARPKGVAELSRTIQGGALRFMKARWQKEPNKPISGLFEELWEEDKIATARLIFGLIPKEHLIDVDHSHKHAISVPSEAVADVISIARALADGGSAAGVREALTLDSSEGAAGTGVLIDG